MDFLTELRRIQSADNTEVFDRTTDSLQAIRDFLGLNINIQALVSVNANPQVGQPSIEVARLEIHDLNQNTAVIPGTAYAGTTISIDRYRPGVDAGWVNQLAGTPMVENAGYANYSYTFPAANWQNGDLIRYNVYSCVVTISGVNFYIPPQAKFGVVGGLTTLGTQLDLIFALVNAQQTLQETGGQLTATGGADVVYQVLAPMGIFKPITVKVDTTNMAAGDTMHLSVYEQISGVGGLILSDVVNYAGVQAVPLKTIYLEPNRFGVLVTLHQDAGVNRVYDWATSFES